MTSAYESGRVPEIQVHHRLRIAREWADLEQATLADRMGISRQSVSNAESGRTKPRKITLNAWALATGVPVSWLQNGETPAGPGEGPDGGQDVRHEGLEPPTRWLNPHRRSDDPRASGHVIDLPGPDHDGPLDPEPIAAALEAAA